MPKIFRGNLHNVRNQICQELDILEADKLDASDQFSSVAVTANVSPALADIKHDTTFYNTGASTFTVTLPNTIAADQIGKRFHFTASATYSAPITVTSSLVGLLRDDSNGSAPHTVTNGTLTVTIAGGASSLRYYSIGGDFA